MWIGTYNPTPAVAAPLVLESLARCKMLFHVPVLYDLDRLIVPEIKLTGDQVTTPITFLNS